MSVHGKLSTRFSFRDPVLFFARARLIDNRLELTGWQLSRRYRRTIPLDRIVHVDQQGTKDLIIWLVDGEVVRLRIDKAAEWHNALTQVS